MNIIFNKAKTIIDLIKLYSLFNTLYFNFHCFPFNVAIRLPVLVTRFVKFQKLKGKVNISSTSKKFGTIKIGLEAYGFRSKSDKAILNLSGGELVLNNNVYIGRGTYIEIGKFGKITLGENTLIGGNSIIISHEGITIGKNARIAWDVTIIDTDFHESINTLTQERSLMNKAIKIGDNNWIGFGSTILKGTLTPNFCIVGAKTLLMKEYNYDECCLLAGHPAKKVRENIYRDLNSYVKR